MKKTSAKKIDLRILAKNASKNSYSPYSHAKVGCSLITCSGKVFTGTNVENSSFGGTICAERVAILKAISEGEKKLQKLYVYTSEGWPPCGLCLQMISEFKTQDLEIIIGDKNGREKKYKFDELFPLAFTPDQFHNK